MKIYNVQKSTISEKSNFQWQQFAVALSAGLIAIASGELFGWPAPSIPKIINGDLGFPVTIEEASIMTTISPLGYAVGCPLAALLMDKIGRKNTLLALAIPVISSWLLIATSTCIEMIYISRFISGISESALFVSFPPYLAEISSPNIRGKLSAIFTIDMITGCFLMNCYGSYLTIKTTAFVSLAFPALFITLFMWMPESPYYLLIKEKEEAAKKSLKFLRGADDVDAELIQLRTDVKRQLSESGSFKELFTIKCNLKAMMIVLGLRTLQQFTGISAIGIYIQVIFKNAKGLLNPEESSIIVGFIQIGITFFGSILVDRYGRKIMYCTSSVLTAIIMFVVGLYFYLLQSNIDVSYLTWIPLVGTMLYVIVLSLGVLVVPNLMAGELFSANVKAKAMGIMTLCLAVCLFFTYKLFQVLDSAFGMYMPFFFFGTCCLIGTAFSYFCVPETKGKTLEEIQQILKGEKHLDKPEKSENCEV